MALALNNIAILNNSFSVYLVILTSCNDLFANTTNEYPETIEHIRWEKEVNGTNIITVIPKDANGNIWTFQKVVEAYGYPMFSKRISNAIRTYQHALSPRTKLNAQEYIEISKNMKNIKICQSRINVVINSRKSPFVKKLMNSDSNAPF